MAVFLNPAVVESPTRERQIGVADQRSQPKLKRGVSLSVLNECGASALLRCNPPMAPTSPPGQF
jgi:hypothetical protein